MEINFEVYSKVTRLDASLRNAIQLDCVELVRRALLRNANVNCRYAPDWNSPLHLAIINRCQLALMDELMSHNPDLGLTNGDNLTACELALRAGLAQLGRKLIEVEFGNVEDPVQAVYEMFKRNSVDAFKMLIEILGLEGNVLVESLQKAWSRIEIMNVAVNREVELYVHLQLLREEYKKSFGARDIGGALLTSVDIQERIQLITDGIDLLERKYDTGLCHDVTDEFLDRLRLIQRHLFVVKNRVENFPTMQLEFCVAMFLGVFDRKPELDLFQLVINKRLLMSFLKQFKRRQTSQADEKGMTYEMLFELTKVMQDNRNKKWTEIMNKWNIAVTENFKAKELIMIRNQLLKSQLMSKIASKNIEDLTKNELSILSSESSAVNQIFQSRKMKHKYKILYRTYFKLKQMYSLQKSVHYVSIVENIDLGAGKNCYVELLAIQRVLQVLGETLKSTKLSPNISSNLRSALEVISPGELLKWISKLRQYFSHEYSATKHTLFRRLRANDIDLIDFYKRVQADLLKVVPLIRNIYADHINRFFKSFLGYVLTMNSVEEVRSYAEACRVRTGFKLRHDFHSSDVIELRKLLTQLEQSYRVGYHHKKIDIIVKIKSKIASYVDFLERNEMNFMTEMVMGCIGELLLCEKLEYQKNLASFYFGCRTTPNSHEYGVTTFLMHGCNRLIRELLWLETTMPDENSYERTIIIQNLIEMAGSSEIQQLHELTLVKDTSLASHTKRIACVLIEESLSDIHLNELNKSLQKYYANLFAIDDKYSIIKTFCKLHKLTYKSANAIRYRKKDMSDCQAVLKNLVDDISDIISLPEKMDLPELVTMIVATVKHGIGNIHMFALEAILLQFLEILSDRGIFADNRAVLESYRPVVLGRNLRNYLAHDSLIYETICRNKSSTLTIMLNAVCLSRFFKVDIYCAAKTIGLHKPRSSVAIVNGWFSRVIECKNEIFEAIDDENFDLLTTKEFELKARDYNNQSVVIATIDQHSEKFIYSLLGRSTGLRPFMEKLLWKALNYEHNFYNDDDFTMAQLFSNQHIRENMTSYLSVKYHHFELEKELDQLYGGIYTTDSLHVAIIFKNEKSALAIIDDDRLYQFCSQDAHNFRYSILMNAILHKLPNVVRRICEVSPELIECSNTSNETPLRIAISTSHKESVLILLEFGAKIHTLLESPIIYALQVRKDDLLELILPLDDELRHNHQLLTQLVIHSSSRGHHNLLKRLLASQSLPISKKTLIESLYMAILYDQCESARLILDFDSSIVNQTNSDQNTPLFLACYCSSTAMVKLLLTYGADGSLPIENPPIFLAIDQYKTKQFQMMLNQKMYCDDFLNKILERLIAQSRYKWIWLLVRQGFATSLIEKQSMIRKVLDDTAIKFIFKVLRFRKDFIWQMDNYTLANAVLLGNQVFVKYVLGNLPSELANIDTTRLLNCAVKANDKNMLHLLHEAGCQVNSPDSEGITPLAMAVTLGKLDLVKALIKLGADPNLVSIGNCNVILETWCILTDNALGTYGGEYYRIQPIILAAMHSHRKIAEYLLRNGAEADVRDQDGFTALIVALSLGDIELVKILISYGVNVEYARQFTHSFYQEGCALHYAATYGFLNTVEWMVDRFRFDVEAKNANGNTLLHLAIVNKRVDIIEYLKNGNLWNVRNNDGETPCMLALKNLDENVFTCVKSRVPCEDDVRLFRTKENGTLLHSAVRSGSLNMVQLLLREFSLDYDWVDNFGNTAIYYAVLKKQFELVEILVSANVSLSPPNDRSSMPPYVAAVFSNQLDIVELFLKTQVDAVTKLNSFCYANKNLIIFSIMQNNFYMCKLLQNSVQFDLNFAYENGNTALHFASSKGSVRIVAFLLESGAQTEQENQDGKTALIMALEHGKVCIAHYLLSKGASKKAAVDFRYKSSNNATILHIVAAKGELESIKFLIDDDFFKRIVTDANQQHIGHYAAANKQQEVIEFLISSQYPLDMLDHDGRSALVSALENEDLQLAKRLIAVGSSLDIVKKFDQRYSLLTQAVAKKKSHLANFLITECSLKPSEALDDILISLDQSAMNDELASVKDKITEFPVLIKHLIGGDLPLAKLLIDDEISLNELINFRFPTRDKETVLHVIARNGTTNCLKLLLEKHVFQVDLGDVDQTTALQEAAMHGQLDCVKLLLQHGANANSIDLQNTTALTRAIINLKTEVTNYLLDVGVDVENTRSFRMPSDGASALHLVSCSDMGMTALLVQRIGIDVNVRDSVGRTALHRMAWLGSVHSVKELLTLGSDPDMVDQNQQTPLVLAILSGHKEIAERLLRATSNREYLKRFRMPSTGKSILHIAFENYLFDLMFILMNDYALDCCYDDQEGKTVLHYAIAAGNIIFIEQLPSDSDLLFKEDNFGESPFSLCLLYSNSRVFKSLVAMMKKVDHLILVFERVLKMHTMEFVNYLCQWLLNNQHSWITENIRFIEVAKVNYDMNLLQSAILRDDSVLVDFFLVCGAERSFLKDQTYLGATTWLHIAALKNYHTLATVILEEGIIPVDSIDEHQQIPLNYAVFMRHIETATVLLKFGANINYQDHKKRMPLLSALENNHKEMVKLLLDNRANIVLLQEFCYYNANENLIQHYLVERGFVDMFNFIISSIDINKVDKHGMTPLHYAASVDQLEMIDILIAAGATIDCPDKHGTTPLMRALSKGHLRAYRKLLSHGAKIALVKEFHNNDYDGETVLHITAEMARLPSTKLLIEELGFDVDCVDKNGNTPLHYAVKNGSFEVVKYLLSKEANINLKNVSGQTVLEMLEKADNVVIKFTLLNSSEED